MNITLKKLAKCVFKSGRQELVREMLKTEFTPEKVCLIAADGIATFSNKGMSKLTESQKGTLHTGCMKAHEVTGKMLEITAYDGEGGHDITESEAKQLGETMHNAVGTILTEDRMNAIIELVVSKVP